MSETRGIRNCNPGNIRKGQSWQGLAEAQTDASFDVFTSPEYGIRAIEKIMLSYKARGLDTVTEIITAWAPSVENDTVSYINAVASHIGVDAHAKIDVTNLATAELLIEAIIQHENGSQPYSKETINAGIKLAGIA